MALEKDLISRFERLKAWLKEHQASGCLIQDPVNLLYYTGLNISTGILYVGLKKQALIVDFRYADRCQKLAPCPVVATKKFKDALRELNLPSQTVIDSQCAYVKDYELYNGFSKVVTYLGFLNQLRMIKDAGEIKWIKKSCALTSKGIQYIQKQCKEGITELELTQKLQMYFIKNGAEKMAFDPIVAFGKNSANPHYTPQNTKLKKNDVVLVDCGVVMKNYHSDMTRTFLFGKVSKKMELIYQLTWEAQKAAIKMCRPSVTVKELNDCVHTIFKKHQVDELFCHGLGHGIGLEIHEGPSLADPSMVLEKGMVITIEPGLYIPGLGGVRIEDSLLVTSKGTDNLTAY